MGLKNSEKKYLELLLSDLDKPLRNKGYKIFALGGCTFNGISFGDRGV